MKFMDKYKGYRPLTEMMERMMKTSSAEAFHKIGPFLKGKTKIIRGYAYEAVKEKKNGRTFMRMDDRVYQVAPDGSWWKCRIMNAGAGKTEIRPRF